LTALRVDFAEEVTTESRRTRSRQGSADCEASEEGTARTTRERAMTADFVKGNRIAKYRQSDRVQGDWLLKLSLCCDGSPTGN